MPDEQLRRHDRPAPVDDESIRTRIIETSADLMYRHGVGSTTPDDVVAAGGITRTQFDTHFPDKDRLVAEVVVHQVRRVIDEQAADIRRLRSLEDLRTWRDRVVADNRRRHGAHGCPLGSLTIELAARSEPCRRVLAAGFEAWESEFRACLRRMREDGVLAAEADVGSLAVALMATLQGGLILARITRDSNDLAQSLDAALSSIRAHAAMPDATRV
jgi:AcrR family transcriptional regulator